MTHNHNRLSLAVLASCALLAMPASDARAIDVGVSVNAGNAVSADVGVSIGGGSGISADANASVGGSNGVNADATANAGGGRGIDADGPVEQRKMLVRCADISASGGDSGLAGLCSLLQATASR
ncbi:hypothetical protein HFN60_17505 [Rhizobium leguminosarum]|uniref:hypothetical protein n=1 Tax=Rhizobium leguminosarum TaxID=384 RepID=UPI001C95EAFD|nr:hypothetical protein [Rhizobium leguminosarum]MBY5817421.1 hypothetical protein [Rhizobium leguminosarum]